MNAAKDMWREYRRTRDEQLKHELCLAHLSLVKYLAGRLAIRLPPYINQEDLESCGVFGLLEAIEKYNPDRGTSFKAYAYSRVRGAMIDEIRRLNWVPRALRQKVKRVNAVRERLQQEIGENITDENLANALGIEVSELHNLTGQASQFAVSSLDETFPITGGEVVRLGDIIADPDSSDPLDLIEVEDGRKMLIEAIDKLSKRDLMVLSLYYQEGLTLKEIGKVLEVSESRVCQIHTRALRRLREKLTQ
ncbi:MAG: FliA/WhiG family RNA polymerase sigma factor [Peptococcaceae bacterium]|nr:FliA/WhiG family RNA polymerase sigma factor [Candidatus Syntrophopropionicum ammoniitolerans]